MLEVLRELIAGYAKDVLPADIKPEDNLRKDLGLSSYDVTELITSIEVFQGVRIPDHTQKYLVTVADFITFFRESSPPGSV